LANITKKLDVRGCSLTHLTLLGLLLLHYLVKFRSLSLGVYKNEIITGLCMRRQVLHHVILLMHVLKMSSSSTNASGGRCWCVISVRWCTILKQIRLMLDTWQIFNHFVLSVIFSADACAPQYDSIKVRWAKLQSFTPSFFVILLAKNYQNWPMCHRVIRKIKVTRFLLRHSVDTINNVFKTFPA